MKLTRKQEQMRAACQKREAKAAAHAAMMRKHEARRASIALYEGAYDAWVAADCKGPMPIHPDNIGLGTGVRAQKIDDDALYATAAELGISVGDNDGEWMVDAA